MLRFRKRKTDQLSQSANKTFQIDRLLTPQIIQALANEGLTIKDTELQKERQSVRLPIPIDIIFYNKAGVTTRLYKCYEYVTYTTFSPEKNYIQHRIIFTISNTGEWYTPPTAESKRKIQFVALSIAQENMFLNYVAGIITLTHVQLGKNAEKLEEYAATLNKLPPSERLAHAKNRISLWLMLPRNACLVRLEVYQVDIKQKMENGQKAGLPQYTVYYKTSDLSFHTVTAGETVKLVNADITG